MKRYCTVVQVDADALMGDALSEVKSRRICGCYNMHVLSSVVPPKQKKVRTIHVYIRYSS
jgi:hypothetical protein